MIKPEKLKIGDTIGVVAPSDPIVEEDFEELKTAREIIEKTGFKVKYSKNLFSNTNGYSATAKEKADDINAMFEDKGVKMIWCACGGNNASSVFEYLNYDLIKNNPKIVCGFSDITSLTNVITEKTGLVTFSGTNLKTIAKEETDYSYKKILERFVDGSLSLGDSDDEFKIINEGQAEGELIGGNLSLTTNLVGGKYGINFKDKILFIEELAFESSVAAVSNYLYKMKQNDVFKQVKGIWVGNYEGEYDLEKILLDTLEGDVNIPIIKSNNFGHGDRKTVIPLGIKARIDTNSDEKIKLLEPCVM